MDVLTNLKPKHVHKYVRIKLGRNKDRIKYKCNLPGCPHYLEPELAVGRIALCNSCNEEFVMNKESIRLAKPHCDNCGKGSKKKDKINTIASILELMER
jgi:hypothetical protein